MAGATTAVAWRGDDDRIFDDRFEDHTVDADAFAWRILERLTYGARPQDVQAFNQSGSSIEQRLQSWVAQQVDWQSIADSACQQRVNAAGFATLGKSIEQLWADHVRGSQNGWPERNFPVAETEGARIIRATYSNRQLYEMMVEFWHDHFNVMGWEFSIAPVFVQHDRDAIRPHALGSFRAMLEGVATSTAMLYYLDNRANRAGGYNENWARELMELHTLGVDVYYPGATHGHVPIDPGTGVAVGYSDADVYDVARCFTGWTVRNGHWNLPGGPEYDTGAFFYHHAWHEGGSKNVLGQWISPSGQEEARIVMDRLVRHPATARHVCRKLCRRFIDDDPPQALVDSAADIWLAHWEDDDHIARVVTHILTSDALLNGTGRKVRRPFELTVAALRKTDADVAPRHFGPWSPYGEFFSRLQQAGHASFRWPAPDGYPDTAGRWTSVSVMGQSWRLLSRLPELRQSSDGPFLLKIHDLTLQGLPGTSSRTAENLVDWWLARLVGRPVLPARRTELIDFMRQNAAPDAPLDLTSNLPYGIWSANNLSNHYTPVRLRAMVSLIMTLPEFHQR